MDSILIFPVNNSARLDMPLFRLNIQVKAILILLTVKVLIMSDNVIASPYFGVDIDINNVAVDIRVNDIPAYFSEKKGQLMLEVPVPDSIIDGLNRLSISTGFPKEGVDVDSMYEKGAYASATLFRQEGEGKKQKLISVIVQFYPGGIEFIQTENHLNNIKSTPDMKVKNGGNILLSEAVEIKSPFPRWVWQDGKNIEYNQENYDSLIEAYRDIHSAMESRDLDELYRLYSQRAIETAAAYSLSDEMAGHKKLSTGKDMINKDLELYRFRTDYEGIRLNIFANGRLARIVVNDRFHQPVLFTEPKARLYHFHTFGFYLNKENKWVMIR